MRFLPFFSFVFLICCFRSAQRETGVWFPQRTAEGGRAAEASGGERVGSGGGEQRRGWRAVARYR